MKRGNNSCNVRFVHKSGGHDDDDDDDEEEDVRVGNFSAATAARSSAVGDSPGGSMRGRNNSVTHPIMLDVVKMPNNVPWPCPWFAYPALDSAANAKLASVLAT